MWAERRAATATWVAEADGVVVGFSDIDAVGYIDMLYVTARHHRRGIAAALLSHLETLANAAQLSCLWTNASLTARPFFERHGFHVVEFRTVTRSMTDLINIRMEKPLSPRR